MTFSIRNKTCPSSKRALVMPGIPKCFTYTFHSFNLPLKVV